MVLGKTEVKILEILNQHDNLQQEDIRKFLKRNSDIYTELNRLKKKGYVKITLRNRKVKGKYRPMKIYSITAKGKGKFAKQLGRNIDEKYRKLFLSDFKDNIDPEIYVSILYENISDLLEDNPGLVESISYDQTEDPDNPNYDNKVAKIIAEHYDGNTEDYLRNLEDIDEFVGEYGTYVEDLYSKKKPSDVLAFMEGTTGRTPEELWNAIMQ